MLSINAVSGAAAALTALLRRFKIASLFMSVSEISQELLNRS